MNLYNVTKIALSPVTDRYFTVKFHFKDGKLALCTCPLDEGRLKEWGVVLAFGSGSASYDGYEKLKERGCIISEEDAKRNHDSFEKILAHMKWKVANRVERPSQEEQEVFMKKMKDEAAKPKSNWYEKSQPG